MSTDRRLIELTLPLKAISDQSAREESIHHGHTSTLRIWWARRLGLPCALRSSLPSSGSQSSAVGGRPSADDVTQREEE